MKSYGSMLHFCLVYQAVYFYTPCPSVVVLVVRQTVAVLQALGFVEAPKQQSRNVDYSDVPREEIKSFFQNKQESS